MPELSRFYGITIQIHFDENQRHHKPHFHANYGEYSASVGVDGEIIEGYLPPKQLRIVSGWAVLHEEELYEAWVEVIQNKIPKKIEPLH
jgi:hypothetical protein